MLGCQKGTQGWACVRTNVSSVRSPAGQTDHTLGWLWVSLRLPSPGCVTRGRSLRPGKWILPGDHPGALWGLGPAGCWSGRCPRRCCSWGWGPLAPLPSALSSSSSELHCSCWPHRFHCPRYGCPQENMDRNHHTVPPGASRCYYLETATGFPDLQLPTLSRTDGTCKIKQEAANLALTEIRNVLSLRASPWAGSAGTGALQGRHQRL